jgi:small GTP-binding protein
MSELLRFATAGSVDDGKSTLIGRLLYDSKSIFEDQLESVADASERMGLEGTNLALLTDGLRAEREQGITIDVAYRYFATPSRKFIIADTPGHEQYTRNMVTGASTADLAIVLVDARKGLLQQSRRHAYIASLLRIPHLVLAVNKMDLVDYDGAFATSSRSSGRSPRSRHRPDVHPDVALNGDNVVSRSPTWSGTRILVAAPPGVGAHRLGPQPDRRPLPGAVRAAPEHRRVPRLPRVRRTGRRRRVQAG